MSRIDVMSQAVLLVVAQTMVLLALSPFIVGLIRKVKARLQCRRGASVFQPSADRAELFKTAPDLSTATSWIFTATPYILFASTLAAGLLVPVFVSQTPLNFAGNIIALVYLLALGTFFLMLAGLDAGSAFGGMGSSREAIVASLTEPAAILSIFAIALTTGSTNLSTIVHKTALLQGIDTAPSPHLMALAALFIVTIAETGRVPVDNPATHLELTMIHEAMILEYSGRYLALVEWASGIRLLVFLTLIVNVFAPWGIATTLTPVAFLTAIHHIYIAAALTIIIKVLVIPRILKKVIERLNVTRELVMNVNVPTGLLICGGLAMLAFFITQPLIPLGFQLTQGSLGIALAIVLIGFFTMIARKKAVTQVIGFLVMENGLFLGATASAYGMPLIVELGVFFDVLVGMLIVGIYAHRLQDAFDSVDTSQLTTLKE